MPHPIYLVTGATGSLGGSILSHLIHTHSIPPSSITVTASSPSRAALLTPFITGGATVRIASFDDKASLVSAFKSIDKLFFVSTDTFDVAKRERQHKNVVEAVVEARVGHVFYSSLAIGGLGQSQTRVMAAHLTTERMLKESGATFTSVREGVYTNCFPSFLNWYPTDRAQKLYLPADGKVAWAAIDELGEATAKLMIEGGRENEIVLLSGPQGNSFSEIVEAINAATGRSVTLEFVSTEEYILLNSANDEGEKPADFFHQWSSLYDEIATGATAEPSKLLGELLGREPKTGVQWVMETLKKNPEYTWHQQYANDSMGDPAPSKLGSN